MCVCARVKDERWWSELRSELHSRERNSLMMDLNQTDISVNVFLIRFGFSGCWSETIISFSLRRFHRGFINLFMWLLLKSVQHTWEINIDRMNKIYLTNSSSGYQHTLFFLFFLSCVSCGLYSVFLAHVFILVSVLYWMCTHYCSKLQIKDVSKNWQMKSE